MRRYLSLLPLLLIVVAVNAVTPRVAKAQSCLDHDETLTVNADGTWATTSFVTDPFCNYKIVTSGLYDYGSGDADAFYRSTQACHPEWHLADHCMVWDFTQSTGGWWINAQNGQATGQWVDGVGYQTRLAQTGLFSKEDVLDIGNDTGTTVRTTVYSEIDASYAPGQGASAFQFLGQLGGTVYSRTTAFDEIVSSMTAVSWSTGIRFNIRASLRNATGSPVPSPRGFATLRRLSLWYDGPVVPSWTVPLEWEGIDNLVFEPIEDEPQTLGWSDPRKERDSDGVYEFYFYGSGDNWRFKIDDEDYVGNSGSLSVRVFATDDNPPPVFKRPLEIDDVHGTYDWFDTNGIPDPAGTHCSRVGIALEVMTGYTSCQQINRIALGHTSNTVVQTSNAIDAPVHAVAAGYVLERRALSLFDCDSMTVGNTGTARNGEGCLIEIPNWATPTDKALFIESVANPIYVVRVQHTDDTEMRYLITNPRVTAGQDINDSCVLGETIPMRAYTSIAGLRSMFTSHYMEALPSASPPPIWNLFADIIDTGGASPEGVTVMGYLTAAAEVPTPYLGPPDSNYSQIVLNDYSDPANSCDTTANFADCVSINPQFFNEGEYWLDGNSSVPALWTNPGVILEPSASIVLPNLTLDPMVAYGASLQIERFELNPFSSARVEVRIGQSVYPISSSGPISTQTIPEQTHTATDGVLYDLVLTNTGDSDVKIHYFCLSEGEAQTIPQCLLDNHSFDLGLTGWDTNGAVVSSGFVPGAIDAEDGEWISQAVLLNPGDSVPHEYTIEVEAEFSQVTGGQIVMAWGSTPVTGGGFVSPASGTGRVMRVVSGVLTVSTTGTNDLTITAHVPDESGPPTAGTVTIRRVCILGPYPGQGGGGVVIDQPEGCAAIPYPDSPDVQTVLQWHWYQIDRFNRCTFIPRLNDVYKAILKGFDQLSDQFKFWQQVLYSFSGWMEAKMFPWLAGYLSNIMPGTIIAGGGECNDLFCFLTSLVDSVIGPIVRLFTDLIQQAANLLFSVIGGLLSIFVTLISQLFTLLQVVLQVFFGLIQQFVEAEPIPLPGMPDCDATPTQGICVVWWVADNTVFSGPGAAIIPLIVSILYIEYALWVIAEVKGIITRSAEAL